MKLPVLKLRRVALRDLDDAGARYAVQDPSLPSQFLAEVNSTFVRVRQRPEAFPVVHKNVRRALVHRFPLACSSS